MCVPYLRCLKLAQLLCFGCSWSNGSHLFLTASLYLRFRCHLFSQFAIKQKVTGVETILRHVRNQFRRWRSKFVKQTLCVCVCLCVHVCGYTAWTYCLKIAWHFLVHSCTTMWMTAHENWTECLSHSCASGEQPWWMPKWCKWEKRLIHW